jgi:hypothetical protein
MLMPLTMCAVRLHSSVGEGPDAVTQEVTRCLRLVRLAASRRDTAHGAQPRQDPAADPSY